MTDPETKLSEHFRLREFTRSRYADIYNVPPPEAVDNLRRLCQWLEMLREMYLGAYCTTEDEARIIVNSGYRSQALNRKVGGAKESNHLTGCAVDIRVSGMEQAIRFMAILVDIADTSPLGDFDELYIERNSHHAIWLHLAVRPQGNRRKMGFIEN